MAVAAAEVVSAIQNAFGAEKVITPAADKYSDLLYNFYLSKTQVDFQPAAIFLPAGEEDIVKFLGLIAPHVVANQATFAVRGAGQQPALSCSTIHGGINVDLRNLTGITLENDNKTVSIGAGEDWGKVYAQLQGKGIAVTGGRSNNCGIGGLSLSGGLSFFSSREGFICDNVVNFRLVLASGKVVNANQQENPDLFRCLRGGGNNFGIVTRYDFRTFEQGRFWGGYVMYFPASFPSQIEAYVKEVQDPKATAETHIMVSAGYNAAYAQMSEIMCMNQVYYTKDEENPPVLEPFVTMQPQLDQFKTLRSLDLVEAANEQTGSGSQDARVSYLNTTVKADIATLQAAYDIYVEAIKPIKQVKGLTTSLTLQAYPKSLLARSAETGGNSLGLPAEKGPLMSILLLSFWQEKADDSSIFSTFRDVIVEIDNDAAQRGTAVPFKYLNYAADFQNPIDSYGEENKALLKDASKRYDPDGLFQKGVPGGFKLF